MKQTIENLTAALNRLATAIEAKGFTAPKPQATPQRQVAFYPAPTSKGSVEMEIEITREGRAYSSGNGYFYSGSYTENGRQAECVLFVNSDKCDRVFNVGDLVKCHVRKDREKGKYGETKFWLLRFLSIDGEAEDVHPQSENIETVQLQSELLPTDEDVPF